MNTRAGILKYLQCALLINSSPLMADSNTAYINEIPDFTPSRITGRQYANGSEMCAPVAVSNLLLWMTDMRRDQAGQAKLLASSRYMNTYVKHEIIHYWQAENFGVIKMLFMDDWLIEGMAYSLSDDPRKKLEQPWQSHRTKFTQWYKSVDQDDLVFAIKQLQENV